MINRRTLCLAACVAGTAALPAHAGDPLSYSYWDVQYLNSAVEQTTTPPGTSVSDDVEGIRLALNIGLGRWLYFVSNWDQRRYPDSRDAYGALGLGAHTLNPDYQFFGNVTYEKVEIDVNAPPPGIDDADEGYGVEVGARVPLPDLELWASYKYLDYGKDQTAEITGSRYGGGMALQLSPWWALSAEYRVRLHTTEDSAPTVEDELEYQEWTVGFRRYFATDADRKKRKGGLLFGVGAWFGEDEPEAVPETPAEAPAQ